jgi:hypothetical protein
MPAAIGLWFYRLQPYPERGRQPCPATDLPGKSFGDFLRSFVAKHSKVNQDDDRQRIWYFDSPKTDKSGEVDGYIRYGVYGFESDLIDSKTKAHKYKRQVADYEQIDLYYQLWWPEDSDGALAVMQSFQGRSCISFVNAALLEDFRTEYPGYTLRISKLMPDNLRRTVLSRAPVRAISLIARHVHADKRRNYGTSQMPDEMDVAVRITARKQGSFGPLGQLNERAMAGLRLPVWLVDTKPFDRAAAEIEWNGRRRKVNVFGHSGEAGSIDVTDDVKFGSNGHPTLASTRAQADDLLGSFAEAVGFVQP